MRNCGNQLLKYVIYAGSYKVKNHYYCGVVGCNKKKEIKAIEIESLNLNSFDDNPLKGSQKNSNIRSII